MKKLVLLIPMLLIACTKPETPAQIVYAAQSSYLAALRVEVAYSNLPRCPAAKLCSEVSVMKTVQKADNAAYAALKNAEKAVRTPGFSDNNVTATVASARALTDTFVDITNELRLHE